MAATVLEALKSITAYPVPLRTLVETAERRGLSLSDEATQETLKSKAFNLSKADTLLWLSLARMSLRAGNHTLSQMNSAQSLKTEPISCSMSLRTRR